VAINAAPVLAADRLSANEVRVGRGTGLAPTPPPTPGRACSPRRAPVLGDPALPAWSIETVASAAGATRMTVYNQFGSRAALIEAAWGSQGARTAAHSPRQARRDRHGGVAERARRELIATGEKVRKRSAETHAWRPPMASPWCAALPTPPRAVSERQRGPAWWCSRAVRPSRAPGPTARPGGTGRRRAASRRRCGCGCRAGPAGGIRG